METEKPQTSENTETKPLVHGRFSGRVAFANLVRDALACAAREGWQEIILSDATFEDWPLNELAVFESLQAWSKSGRHMIILATRYDEVLRHHARFVSWRKTWGHLIDCRICNRTAAADFPSVLWSRNWFMQRVETRHSAGICGQEKDRLVQLKEVLDEQIRNSSPGFASSTLGL
ncbi:MAG: hypothetical protein KBE07_07630 [Rhodoferax sp.]|mgnify:FL=1|jgi:hypothetical protein|nr:hypothetical protein [Rhodoferax sp.]